ncbi:hypothetical protein [Dactylosporangium cerinum]
MYTIELCPRPELGPSSMKKFGKPGMATPRYARGEPAHTSLSSAPSRPRTLPANGMSVTWKPVPKTMTSTSRATPSASTTLCSRISRSASGTSSTLGRCSAGYQSLDGTIRLHPNV